MLGTFRAVLFDLDYTLVDASRGVLACVNYALAGMALPPASPEQVFRTIGLPLPDALIVLTGPQDAAARAEFVRLFSEHADQVMLDHTVLLDHARETVCALHAHGLALGVVTNKYHRRVVAVLAREGLAGCFRAIVGSDDVAVGKPDPEGLHLAARQLGAAPSEILYVGDSLTDAEATRRAEMPFAAVLTGVTPRASLEAYHPLCVLDTLQSLPACVGVPRDA
ncbi:MAG: HAD family hydrolase [Anaerolineae bacterium]